MLLHCPRHLSQLSQGLAPRRCSFPALKSLNWLKTVFNTEKYQAMLECQPVVAITFLHVGTASFKYDMYYGLWFFLQQEILWMSLLKIV